MSYPKFIELHGDVTGQILSANVAHIVMFSDGVIVLSNEPMSRDGKAFHVSESYDDLKTLIKDCGCLIHKADPRLDSKPLTFEELEALREEPVYSAYLSQWLLVVGHIDTLEVIDTVNSKGVVYPWTKEELLAKPLYRMKVDE